MSTTLTPSQKGHALAACLQTRFPGLVANGLGHQLREIDRRPGYKSEDGEGTYPAVSGFLPDGTRLRAATEVAPGRGQREYVLELWFFSYDLNEERLKAATLFALELWGTRSVFTEVWRCWPDGTDCRCVWNGRDHMGL